MNASGIKWEATRATAVTRNLQSLLRDYGTLRALKYHVSTYMHLSTCLLCWRFRSLCFRQDWLTQLGSHRRE